MKFNISRKKIDEEWFCWRLKGSENDSQVRYSSNHPNSIHIHSGVKQNAKEKFCTFFCQMIYFCAGGFSKKMLFYFCHFTLKSFHFRITKWIKLNSLLTDIKFFQQILFRFVYTLSFVLSYAKGKKKSRNSFFHWHSTVIHDATVNNGISIFI